MRFLADECLDGRLIQGLRQVGHDVQVMRDQSPGADDRAVLDAANRADRILLTEDKDFGDLVVREGLGVPGLVLVRYSQGHVRALLDRLLALAEQQGEGLKQHFVVVTPDQVRSRRLGSPPVGST
jgi:predicted nuclease of predicted toxin-antitoxin system